MKNLLAGLAVALFLLPLSLSAQTGTWTAVASTGAIDSASLGVYQTNGTFLQFAPGPVGTLTARYNVTNTFGGGVSDFPGWNTLELGYADNAAGAQVTATLFQVERCSGARIALCTVVSADSAAATCRTCTFGQAINFGAFLYYVEVTVSRNANNLNPSARTLRIF